MEKKSYFVVTLEEVARLIHGLGSEGVARLSSNLPRMMPKYGNLTLGQIEALLNIIGEENFDKLLSHKASIRIGEVLRKLVDKKGQMIPSEGARIQDICMFKSDLIQPAINYTETMSRLNKFFPGLVFLSAKEFQRRSEELLEQLRQHSIFSNLLHGLWLPVCYPKFKLNDYGEDSDNIYIKAAGDSYKEKFPERQFNNCRKGELKLNLKVVDDSHKLFITKMEIDSMVGIQFFPFRGFSIEATSEIMSLLPKSVHLSGPIDISTAITAYPDVLASDFDTPRYDCDAVCLENCDQMLFYYATCDSLKFGYPDDFEFSLGIPAYKNYSAGLVFTG